MKVAASAAVLLAAVALTATACSSSTPSNGGSSSARPSTAPSSTTPASPGGSGSANSAAVAVRDTPLGKILVDGQGRTLYLFEADTTTTPTCYGPCASAWPPDTVTGTPQAGPGVTAKLLGTTARTDHTTQLTYHGHPLYTFTGDAKPGDTKGEGSKAFGASWYVVAPSGNTIDNS